MIAGQRIAGATLYFRDISTVGSGADGTFTLAVPGKSFMLTRVQKNGYELADRDLLGKTYSTSSEPFIVVMDTPDALLAQRLSSERKLRRTLQQQLQAREDEIEALREQQRITEDEYHKKLQELYASQENNEKLIADMAERYARMDFDQLDDFRRRVAACIQNGELTRADSLLSTKGSVEERAARLGRQRDAIREDAADLARRHEAHDKSVALHSKELEDFGADCYSRAEICLMEHKNDSAAYYLELRANTDTLNAEWQFEAGIVTVDYVAEYNKSIQYLNRALRIFSSQQGDIKYIAYIYHKLGINYSVLALYDAALENAFKALEIFRETLGENSVEVSGVYNSISSIYSVVGDYEKALEYLEKDLNIALQKGDSSDIAITYCDLGNVYRMLGDYDKAEEYLEKSISLYIDNHKEDDEGLSDSYNIISLVCTSRGDFNKSLEYLEKALEIALKWYDDSQPLVANIYNNMGLNYHYLQEYGKALEYYDKSVRTNIRTKGERNPSVAIDYNNIAGVYHQQGDYDTALQYYDKGLDIQLEQYGEKHIDNARSYHNIGNVYIYKGDFEKARDLNQKSLALYTEIFNEEYPDLIAVYEDLAMSYSRLEDYENSLKYGKKELNLLLNLYGESPRADMLYIKIAVLYWTAKSNGEKLPGFDDFMSEFVFVGTIVPGETAAAQQGLAGEYTILEFGDWNIGSESSLWEKSDELRGKPKTIVVMQDGKITQHHFENVIGMGIDYKHVGRAERQRILDEYYKWKAQ